MTSITPQQFVQKWEDSALKERSSYQEHFMDVCHLVGHPTPAALDPTGETFTFEAGVKKLGGGQGWADVWYKGHFAIEYKGKGKYDTLEAAYDQLLKYRENLDNPPLLIVCDIANWEIHTNWPNTSKKVYRFKNTDLTRPTVQRVLYNLFYEPNALHPDRTTEQVTADAADVFKQIAENMRDWQAAPERIARFLTKLVFCLFAEDVSLLPIVDTGKGIFSEIIAKSRQRPTFLARYLRELFVAMRDGGEMLFRDIPYFNGGLFENVDVEELSLEALTALERACNLDWSAVQPGIFGTLFERSLDPSKRAQLGAHYTSEDDIRLIVEPVLMQPLRREWEALKAEAAPIRAAYEEALAERNVRKQVNRLRELEALRDQMLERLRSVTVLDPACGSGNFLYVALQALLDLEKEVRLHPLFADLPPAFPGVHPRQLYGIEKDAIAHDLASIVVWIGYIQWWRNNGERYHSKPILEPLDNIERKDAILAFDEAGNPVEPEWPGVDVIVSNPPFLGNRKLRSELGDEYIDSLVQLFRPAFGNLTPDLVCYWYEKSRRQLETGGVKRVGLLATNSIRGGTNRLVLERIADTGRIFMAWSDREWILDGAAVRVSIVGFDSGHEQQTTLNGLRVTKINPDLTQDMDITEVRQLGENQHLSFQGIIKRGPFDMPEDVAMQMIRTPNNDDAFQNLAVLKPVYNGIDITRRCRRIWIVDFGIDTPIEVARKFSLPFQYVETHVQPMRATANQETARNVWWLHWNPRPAMREALAALERYIATPTVSKHRLFVWLDRQIHPDHQLIVFARSDDYFFGVLHSRFHEVWALRMGTWLGKGNDPRYTPTTTFETFPFPWPPGQEPVRPPHPQPLPHEEGGASDAALLPSPLAGEGPGMGGQSPGMGAYAAYRAISTAAARLHAERDTWLNPPGVPESQLKDRTLTNLYNALAVFRGDPPAQGKRHPPVKPAAGDFAPRLAALHRALDEAVCDAYGWEHDVLADEEEILRRLLALNLARAKD